MNKKIIILIFLLTFLCTFTGCTSQKLTDELVKSVGEDQITKVDELLKNNGNRININVLDENGRSLLMNAIINRNDFVTLYALIDNNIKLNIQDKDGKTALMYAAQYNDSYLIDYMIKKGCNINLKDKENNTALLYLLKIGHDKGIVTTNISNSFSYLIGANADVNVQDRDGKTPLIYVASNIYTDEGSPTVPSDKRETYISRLLKAGANEAIIDNEGHDYQYYNQKTQTGISRMEDALKANRLNEIRESLGLSVSDEKKSPKIGMTADEILNSTWGKPKDINKTTTKYGTSEQWVYDLGKYIYLEDGIVTAIQQ
ncbi:ankyrin repeat domain-containing protein [Clostridium sp. BSD9I1]|uniref:ankyrin repeat domain-containing protein n=1 Tax=Clostridium sp. BSD9I1 TaxID=2003589 RepID=UPI00164573EE|nr:ankyrin repeat domain-containing protein [Clostridium sp. BSD9I1]